VKRGKFIVLEGIDGSGTTTQSTRLAEALERKGHRAHPTREPSTGLVGRFLREILASGRRVEEAPDYKTMALLFAADRADHCAIEIAPRLAEGEVVISDRYLLSSIVYQSATSAVPEEAAEFVRAVNRGALVPDLTVVVDIDPRVAKARRTARGGAPELYEVDELQGRLASLYLDAERLLSEHPIVHLRGEGSVEDVTAELLAHVERVIGLGEGSPA
jgi:dTMP kinase